MIRTRIYVHSFYTCNACNLILGLNLYFLSHTAYNQLVTMLGSQMEHHLNKMTVKVKVRQMLVLLVEYY